MFGNDMVEVRVNDNSVLFRTGTGAWATIDGLQLSREGVIREFPDLISQVNWKEQAIERFKDKIASFKDEESKMKYIVEDLARYGYVAKYKQKGGHRVKRIA